MNWWAMAPRDRAHAVDHHRAGAGIVRLVVLAQWLARSDHAGRGGEGRLIPHWAHVQAEVAGWWLEAGLLVAWLWMLWLNWCRRQRARQEHAMRRAAISAGTLAPPARRRPPAASRLER